MSRMTKFLKQTAVIQLQVRDANGNAVLDLYGDPSYEAPISIPTRRERTIRDVLTATGAVMRSDTTYYIDEQHLVQIGDLIDGKPIIDFEEYINEHGLTEGYRVVV